MVEITVRGGTVSDVMVKVTGDSNHSIAVDLSNTIDRVMHFINRAPQNSPSGNNSSLVKASSFSGDLPSQFGPGNLLKSGPPYISSLAGHHTPMTTIHGNGSSVLTLQGVVTDFSDLSQHQRIVDSSVGGNRITLDQGTVAAGQSVNDTISAAADLTVIGGKNETVSAGGHLEFIGGTGESYISAHDAIIYGTDGSRYHFIGTSPGSAFSDKGEGNSSQFMGAKDQDGNYVHDILFDASSSHGAFSAVVGNKDTIIGGTASDKFSITSDTHASGEGQEVSATLAGGSGAANLFQFMDNEGGHYTITDFGSAAGNLVAIKGTKADVKDALRNATVEGGNTTIRLKDKTEITFLGDDHVSENDFITNILPNS